MTLNPPILQQHLIAWFLRRTPQSGVRRVDPLSGAVASDIGMVRSENQDRVALFRSKDKYGRVFVVAALADGIGGMRDGAKCAATTLGCFLGSLAEEASDTDDTCLWLNLAVKHTNLMVHSKFDGNGGSTLAAVILREGGKAFWLNVGDSRIYSSKGSILSQLSVDDTIAGQLGKSEPANIGQSRLIQFIGIGDSLELQIEPLDTVTTEAVLLTSDGIHFIASSPNWLGLIVGNASEPGLCVRRLTELSKWCGGPDNASAAIIQVASATKAGNIPEYSCVEIWDPFGETQIIKETANAKPPLANIEKASSSVTSSDLSESGKETSSEFSSSPNQNNTHRTSKPKTRKKKGPKNSSDKPSPESQQLLIDFPNENG